MTRGIGSLRRIGAAAVLAALTILGLGGAVRADRAAVFVAIDGTRYEVRMRGRLEAPRDLDLSEPAAARAWEAFVEALPRQPGYRRADLRVGARAEIEIRLEGELTPSKPALGLPFTQEPDSAANLLTLRLMENGEVELRLNPEAAEGGPLRAEVRALVLRGLVTQVEGARKPALGEPYVWRLTQGGQPLRLRLRPPFSFWGAAP